MIWKGEHLKLSRAIIGVRINLRLARLQFFCARQLACTVPIPFGNNKFSPLVSATVMT